jgi:lysophospholipase L1-like esterase
MHRFENRIAHPFAPAAVVALVVFLPSGVVSGAVPHAQDAAVLKALQLKPQPLFQSCRKAGPAGCARKALANTFGRLRQRGNSATSPVRMIQFGDSHVASDLITKTIREDLQAVFGDGGRGFTMVDQPWKFGGRRLRRGDAGWRQERVVDAKGPGKAYGFSGESIVSIEKDARVTYQLVPEDRQVGIYFEPVSGGGEIKVFVDGNAHGVFSTGLGAAVGQRFLLTLPPSPVPRANLKVVAAKPGVRIHGLSFESGAPGLIYESIGPVGADAQAYLDFGRQSFVAQLKVHKPDLVVLMVGGNDALKVRKGVRTLDEVREDHRALIRLLQDSLPDSDCLLWAPLDAGYRKKGKVVSLPYLGDVRDIQRSVAEELGCGFWDALTFMGGAGSIARWVDKGIMNDDLVHPKSTAARIVGRGFAAALLDAERSFGSQ